MSSSSVRDFSETNFFEVIGVNLIEFLSSGPSAAVKVSCERSGKCSKVLILRDLISLTSAEGFYLL